ncbi:MAG: HigA family addiction module antitoxin [Ginsengibacter sp.]
MNKNNFPPHLYHPGQLIKEEIQTRKISQIELSKLTGVATNVINEILKGKRNCTPEFAVKLEDSLKIDAKVLLRLQMNYDIAKAKSNTIKKINQLSIITKKKKKILVNAIA